MQRCHWRGDSSPAGNVRVQDAERIEPVAIVGLEELAGDDLEHGVPSATILTET